jgi:hypothetical protein
MSDMDEALYNGWLMTMGPAHSRVYCAWHVKSAWKKNINKIKNKEMRESTYQELGRIMEIMEENKFIVSDSHSIEI